MTNEERQSLMDAERRLVELEIAEMRKRDKEISSEVRRLLDIQRMRPELAKLFDAHWKCNEPGYRFLDGKE